MARTSILEYLDNFQRHAREEAYVHHRGYRVQRWTYGEVLANAHRFARELDSREIAKGDRVLIWGENCAEWVVAFFGCLLRGAIVVPIDKIATPDFAQRVAQQVDAKLCVCSTENQIADVPSMHLETLRDRIAVRSDVPVAPPLLIRDDIVEIVFTSGTTAEPRGVVISHGNILANLEPLEREIGAYLRYERIFHPLRFLNLLPLSHVFGQFLGIFLPQLLAATVLFQDTLNPTEVMRVIKRERVSVVVAVPRLLESLKDKVVRDLELAGRSGAVPAAIRGGERPELRFALVALPPNPQSVWVEILGFHLGRRGARRRDRRVLAALEFRGHSRLRPDRDNLPDLAEPSVSYGQALHREGAGGARGQAG